MKTMRVGIMSAFYPVPAEYDNADKWVWQIKRTAELGCRCIHLSMDLEDGNDDFITRMRDVSKSADMELEVRSIQQLFSMNDANEAEVMKAFDARIRTMKMLGTKIMRMGYGRLKIDSSRYNKDISVKDHLAKLTRVLKKAAKVLEANDIYLAIENHCDFKASELIQVFDAVGSSHVGCALDTANGFTVYCDPNEEVQILAPYAITTHIKDMVVVQETIPGRIPFRAVGCALGEGHVDIPAALEAIAKKAPNPKGMHLLIETGWMPTENMDKPTKDAYMLDVFHKSINYLLKATK